MNKKLIQIVAGAGAAFIATSIIYYLLQRDSGIFSGIIVAILTGLGIAIGQKLSS